MKKVIILIFLILIIMYVYINLHSHYNIEYKVDKYQVYEMYDNQSYYFEIDNTYNFLIHDKKKWSKKVVKSIKMVENDLYSCISVDTSLSYSYPLCLDKSDNSLISYDLVDEDLLNELNVKKNKDSTIKLFDSNISYSSDLNSSEYVAIWNYKGFYLLSGDGLSEVSLFDNSTYNCNLCTEYNGMIITPNYDESYQFHDFKLINMVNGKVKNIETKYEISYDSTFVGSYKNDLYLFDKKYDALYKINISKRMVNLVGNDDMGFFIILNGKKKPVSKSDYISGSINFFDDVEKFAVDDNVIVLNHNDKIKFKYSLDVVNYLNESNYNIYYVSGDNLYRFDFLNGSQLLFHDFEFNFNNNIFIYNN